jgi:hypothetical protein
MFEWGDQNQNNEDRVGYFVAIDGESEKIRIANETDEYVVGIVSSSPALVGDSGAMRWKNKFLTDEWGRTLYEEKEVTIKENPKDENSPENTYKEIVPKINPEYDPDKPYIPREERPEWSAIGMLGKLLVRDDGTCQVGGYCKPNADGIATSSPTGYRVIKRINENIVKVIFR